MVLPPPVRYPLSVMSPITIALTLSLLCASPTPRQVRHAVDVVATCSDLRSAKCLQAATTLELADERVFKLLSQRFANMSTLGQMMALSVFGSHPGHESTMGLAKLVLKAKLAPAIRSVAIQTLASRFHGRRSRRLVTSTLLKVARDDVPTVRAAAVRALGNRAMSGDRHIITVLRRAASDAAPAVRTEAVLGLGMSGKAKVAPLLINALTDAVLRVRVAAADGLSFVKSPDAVEPLIEALRSEDALFRRVAGEALASQTGVRFGEDYPLWREWFVNR
jgi:hypothetical protein